MKYFPSSSAQHPGLLRKSVTAVATVAVAGVALMFSAVVLSGVLIAGAAAFTYLWWKTRKLRKQMQDFSPRNATMEQASFKGEVIEGEAIRVDETVNRIER